jgi:selenocysteine lyase/cysteine desulfurase
MATNDEAVRGRFDAAYADFIQRFPEYTGTSALDELRATEYRRLDDLGQVYLDYTGGSLYAQSQIEKHSALLHSGVFGNPHSSNPASAETTRYVESCRQYVLRYFHASPEDHILVFTANASAGLKLVGESFPFAPGGRLLLTFDNHNSVNGIREFARAKGTEVRYAPLVPPGLRLDFERLESLLDQADAAQENLFALPTQSNVSGVKHPLELVAKARDGACYSMRAPTYPRIGST